jgi:hypothetical protein
LAVCVPACMCWQYVFPHTSVGNMRSHTHLFASVMRSHMHLFVIYVPIWICWQYVFPHGTYAFPDASVGWWDAFPCEMWRYLYPCTYMLVICVSACICWQDGFLHASAIDHHLLSTDQQHTKFIRATQEWHRGWSIVLSLMS